MEDGIINLDIEYVDYVVARNMISTLDSWVREIEVTKRSKLLKFLQRYSHWIPQISGVLLFLFSTLSGIYSADVILNNESTLNLQSKFLISTFSFITVFYFIGNWFGRMAEYSIDRIEDISYIEINKGDKKLLEEFKKRNNRSIAKTFASFVLITVHAISCSYIGTLIFEALK